MVLLALSVFETIGYSFLLIYFSPLGFKDTHSCCFPHSFLATSSQIPLLFLILSLLNLGVMQNSIRRPLCLSVRILLFISSSLEALSTHCILTLPPLQRNDYNSRCDLSTEFHTTTSYCLRSISTWLPNRQTDSSHPNLGP